MIDRSDSPLFLVGAERSGTTLLRLMLGHHPLLAWQNEFEFAVDLMGPNGQPPEMSRYRDWLSLHRIFQATRFEIDESLGYAELVHSFLEQKRAKEGKPIVGATVHRHFDRLLHLWPNARLIHLVRDPRDVTRSVIAMGWAGNVWTGVRNWRDAETIWDRTRSQLTEDRYHELQYEALLAKPKETLTAICSFIGIPYDEAMLSYPNDTTYDAPDPSLAFQWKKKLTQRQVRLVESRVSQLMTQRGYELSGLDAMRVGPIAQARLLIQDRIARSTFRLNQFGVGLTLAYAFSSRFGPASWQRLCIERINEVTRSRLK